VGQYRFRFYPVLSTTDRRRRGVSLGSPGTTHRLGARAGRIDPRRWEI